MSKTTNKFAPEVGKRVGIVGITSGTTPSGGGGGFDCGEGWLHVADASQVEVDSGKRAGVPMDDTAQSVRISCPGRARPPVSQMIALSGMPATITIKDTDTGLA